MKWILLTGLWVGTLTASFLIGRSLTIETPPERTTGGGGETVAELQARVADLARENETLRALPDAEDETSSAEAKGNAAAGEPAIRSAVPAPLSLDGIKYEKE